LTQVLFDISQRDSFETTGKTLKKFWIFKGNFPNPNQRWLTRPGSKFFDPKPSLLHKIRLTKHNQVTQTFPAKNKEVDEGWIHPFSPFRQKNHNIALFFNGVYTRFIAFPQKR